MGYSGIVGKAVLVLLTLALAGPVIAQNKLIELGKTKAKNTLEADEDGEIDFDVKNTMNIKANDIHFEIVKPTGYEIADVESDNQIFDNHWPSLGEDSSSSGGAKGGWVDQDGGGDDQVAFKLKIVDAQGADADEGEDITITTVWSRWGNAVAMFSPDGIGAEGESTALLANIVPNYDATPVNVALNGPSEVTCNDIAIGETFQYRFESGSLVVKPSNGRFELDPEETEVKGFNENGDDVTGTGAFGVSNVRINDQGHLVFEVSRDRTDDLHVAIVIRGLKLTGLDAAGEPHNINVGMSGAAISGECVDNLTHIVSVQDD